MGFCSLQRLRNRRSASRGRSPARHVPPSGFDYPLDGLLPSRPCRSCFVPAALLGFALRSFLLPKGNRPFPPGRTHLPFRSPVYPHTRGAGAGLASRGSWALTLPRVPGERYVFSTPFAGCSPGLHPFRATGRSLGRDFTRTSSRALARLGLHLTAGASEYRSASTPPHPPDRQAARVRVRHPLGVSAPSRSQSCESANTPGYVFTSRSCPALLPAAERSLGAADSTGVVRTYWRC